MTKPNKLLLDEEWLRDQYLVQRKSMSQIGQELGCQQETVSRYIHKYNIPIRTQSEEIGGERHPLYGKHHSEKSIRKNSESHIGIPLSEEHKRKISLANSGENNPRYGVTISEDQKQRQSKSLRQFYKEHPESIISLSGKRKQYYIDNPNAALEMSEHKKEYYKEHPEVLLRAAEKRVQYYIDHPLSPEEKQKRAEPVLTYFKEHPEARKEHSKLMKACNPSMRPDVAAKISDSMVEWHKNNVNPVGTGSMPGRFFIRKDGRQLWLRSSYEFRIASILEELRLTWQYEPFAFPLESLHTSYRPDIYLPDNNIWIEIKGYLSWSSKQKLIEFNNIYPNEKLLLVYIRQIEEIEELIIKKEVIDIQDYCIPLKEQIEVWKLEDIELEKLKQRRTKDNYER